jgi:hypothetical protein
MQPKPGVSRVLRAALIAACAVAGWSSMASVLFAFGIGHSEILRFPYIQWFAALSVVRSMLWLPHSVSQAIQHPLAWLVLSAIGPSALVVAFLLRFRRSRIGQPRSLYGDTAWADAGEQRANNVRQSARLP